jgi:hypothetical protein
MFVLANVTKWVDQRDSTKRTHKRDIWALGYRQFLLNPNRIVDLKDRSTLVLPRSSFLFSDNHRDRREGTSYLEVNLSPAQIETAHNTAFHSKFITLPFYPKNNPHKVTVDVTLDVEDIAYFDDYNDPDHPNCCWVVYCRKSFKRIEQLVGLTIREVEDLAENGHTTSSTSDEQ